MLYRFSYTQHGAHKLALGNYQHQYLSVYHRAVSYKHMPELEETETIKIICVMCILEFVGKQLRNESGHDIKPFCPFLRRP
jgi:hypothetical protein